MKKILLSFSLALLCIPAFAQVPATQGKPSLATATLAGRVQKPSENSQVNDVAAYEPQDIVDAFAPNAVTLQDMQLRAKYHPYIPEEIVVAMELGTSKSNAASVLDQFNWQGLFAQQGVELSSVLMKADRGSFCSIALVLLSLPEGTEVFEAMKKLEGKSGVLWSSPNFYFDGDPREFIPNDPDYAYQYHHPLMKNDQAWDITLGNPSIIIAITDDGVELTHSDLAPNIWVNTGELPGNGIDDDGNGYIDDVNGWDFSSGNNNPNPNQSSDSHGTHVAGIAAARTNNSIGVAGVSGHSTIMPLQFYGGDPWTAAVINATFTYAADNGAKIVNTSYNIDFWVGDPVFTAGLQYLYDAGVLHLNSAGNDSYPNPPRQAFQQTLLVASTDASDIKSSFSNYGNGIDISAPGSSIGSTFPGNLYAFLSGTSMATPNAAGVAALIWSDNPTWTRDQVAAQLLATADNIDAANPTLAGLLGSGRVNSYAALTSVLAAPQVKSTQGLPDEGTTISRLDFTSFSVAFNQVMDPATVNNLANFELRSAGPNGIFGDGDDFAHTLLAATFYQIGTNQMTFQISDLTPLRWGLHRLTLVSGGLENPFGADLDGDGNGDGGDDFVRTFSVVNGCPSRPILLVDADATGLNRGTSWTDAFTDLQSALNSTCPNITEIWVAAGTYYPTQVTTDRDATFQLKNGVAIYGGFNGTETLLSERDWVNNVSILSGDINKSGNLTDNSYTVVTGSGTDVTAVIDGFTITMGNADVTSSGLVYDPNAFGGGMFNNSGSPTVTNCSFSGNSVFFGGGGMFNYDNSSPTVTTCSFSGNTAINYGGAMLNENFSSPTVTNCSFSGNTAGITGSGIDNFDNSSPTVTNCSFLGNTAGVSGGGMSNLENCSPTVTNCSFSGNQATDSGGGMFNEGNSSSMITNSIFWGNSSGMESISSTPTVNYSIMQGGYAGTGNLDVDPLFVDQPPVGLGTEGDLRLQACSPAINAGDNTAVPAGITTDLDGNPRFYNSGTVDMGAYEYQGNGSLLTNGIVFVNANVSGGNDDGTSWANAFTDLQDALNSACPGITQIWVAAGTYYPDEGVGYTDNNRYHSFVMKNNLAIYGGFDGTEDPLTFDLNNRDFVTNETILSGDIDQNNLLDAGNAYHVVTGSGTDNTAILDGFSITRGFANGSFPDNNGAGLFISAGSPMISNISFYQNVATANGGGLVVYDFTSEPVVKNCRFFANNAQYGGGIFIDNLTNFTVVNSTFTSNMAFEDGGGIYLDGNFTNPPELVNNTFYSNSAARGGAMFHANSNAIITNSVFFGNTATEGPVFYTYVSNPATETPTTSYSLVDVANCTALNVGDGGTCVDATMIYSSDPLFIDA
ncbi:MAG: S8 family serine peptidase, partial [Bacteroidales bacterium]|nr:S8 family serine peptidase [Bacteroidales bacterium]